MIRSDGYDGSARAFEGETTLLVRSVPAGARLKRATLTVTPVAGPSGALFEERIEFADPADTARTLGATKLAAGSAFVEVDFHKRRTLAGVTGTNLSGASLQVDLGGIYVELNAKGAIKTPTDPSDFTVGNGLLPGLTVAKFKLTAATNATGAPDASSVTIRSVPSNLTVRLAKMAPFWARPGDLAGPATSPDFAAPLQAFLATAPVENGFSLVPLVVHSDTLARLSFRLDIEYLDSVAATPNELSEVNLSYGVGTTANAPVQLSVTLPPGARVVAGDTTARVTGAFGPTRVVEGYGAPTGAVSIAGTAAVTPALAVAQVVAVTAPVSAVAIDLLLTGLTRTAQLGLDLRADLDGKPDGTSLLGQTVPFTLQSTASPAAAWVSVALPKEFHFAPTGKPARYWVVLQSLEGSVSWNVAALAAPAAATPPPLPAMQQTSDGGLSWRTAVLDAPAQLPPLSAVYRFRYQPDRYQVPIEMQIGDGPAATRVKLDRFQPLSRVDFALDVPEVADGINTYLSGAAPAACSQAEHVANGDFRQWHALGTGLGAPNVLTPVTSTGLLLLSADGQYAYAGTSDQNGSQLAVIDVLRDMVLPADAIALDTQPPVFGAASPDGTRLYAGTASAIHVVDAAARTDLGASGSRDLTSPRFGALSPDGASLYVGTASSVACYGTATLEAAARARGTLGTPNASVTANPAGIAVAPDGAHVYVADNTSGGSILVLSAPALDREDTVPVGSALAGIAVTPDGTRVVVLDTQPPAVWIVDLATKSVVASLPIAATPQALAIAADGTQAYLLTNDALGQTIVVLDLARLKLSAPSSVASTAAPSSGAPVTIVATAAGNRLYVADGARQTLTSVPLGTLTPADWTPSGLVQLAPVTTAAPVLVLGDWRASKTAADVSISQVVPVSDGCPYVFAFSASANVVAVGSFSRSHDAAASPDAAAEVIWLSAQCGVARTDTVPIGKAGRSLTPYRTSLRAPAGATQAEIRFRAAAGTFAEVSTVSLAGNADALANGGLQQIGTDGAPTGWSTPPGVGTLAVSARPAAGVRLRNPGAQTAELVQSVDVPPNAQLSLELVGRSDAATAVPTVTLDFTGSDGAAIGSATSIAVDPADFERHLAALAPPPGAVQARVHVRLPPAATLDVQRLSLRSVAGVTVPVSFVAQAPGDLRVSQAVVAYERVPVPPPPVPAAGLCTPTPAGQAPGEAASDPDSCYCTCCNAQRTMQHPSAATTPAGRPATVATCATCGTPMLRVGGPVMAGSAVAAMVFPVVMVAATGASFVTPTSPPPVTTVPGIGPKRAAMLATAGIVTVDDLARSNAKDVASLLRGVSAASVDVILKSAQHLVALRTTG